MSKFVSGKELNDVVYNIIWEAKDFLLIVSPYIKLDNYFKVLFDKHVHNPKIHILIVFGKNENNVRRSLSAQDFDFFKKFMNISIVYIPNLHAKYYANETKGVITSINLYDYSFEKNIEFGVYSETNLLSSFTNSTDDQAMEEAINIAEVNEAVFIKRPVFEKTLLSAITGKHYIKSDILHDTTKKFYSSYGDRNVMIKQLNDFPKELTLTPSSSDRPIKQEAKMDEFGYCIRTGIKIKFNPKYPYSYEAYKSWSFYRNDFFPEKYCHKTGKLSYGKTCMNHPILNS